MKSRLLSAAFVTLTLTACNPPESPRDIARQYWQAVANKDMETARQLVSQDSQALFEAHVESANTPDSITQVAIDDDRTVVVTTINPDLEQPRNDRPFETVMVFEDGEWKINLGQTRLPPPPTELEKQLNELSDSLSGPVEDNLETMEDFINEGMQLLDDSLEQGSKDMSESFQKAMEKMREAMQKSIERMKQRREGLQPAPPLKEPDSESGEGVI